MMFNIFNKRNNWNNIAKSDVKAYKLSPEEIEKICSKENDIKSPSSSIGYTKRVDEKFRNMKHGSTEYWNVPALRIYL